MFASLSQITLAPARFISGDWGMLGQLLSSLGLAQSFDLVVSAETIYSTESMTALLTCIKQASCSSLSASVYSPDLHTTPAASSWSDA